MWGESGVLQVERAAPAAGGQEKRFQAWLHMPGPPHQADAGEEYMSLVLQSRAPRAALEGLD